MTARTIRAYDLAKCIAARDKLIAVLERIAYGLEQDTRTIDGMTKFEAAAMARAAIKQVQL